MRRIQRHATALKTSLRPRAPGIGGSAAAAHLVTCTIAHDVSRTVLLAQVHPLMKLQFLDETSSRPLQSWDLARRLETLLALWKRPRDWGALAATSAPFQSADAARLWSDLIARSEPIEPLSTANGLRAAIDRHNASTSDPQAWLTPELLETSGLACVVGPRAAVRRPLQYSGPMIHGGTSWGLSLTCDANTTPELGEICQTTFASAERIGNKFLVEEAHPVLPQAAALLAGLAFGLTCSRTLVLLWQKAVALGVDVPWIGMLHPLQQRTLAEALGSQLKSIAEALHWHVDLQLAFFEAGQPYTPPSNGYSSRLDELFAAQWVLERLHDSLSPKFVFGQMASAVVLAGDVAQAGNLLTALPPGRAYFSAVGMLCGQRPQLLAGLLAHPAWAPEAMFALADWQDALIVQGHGSMTMHDEWREVVTLSRRLALFYDRGPDYTVATALAVHDESRDLSDTGPSFSRPVPPISTRMEPWRDRLVDAEHAHRAVDAVVARIGVSATDSDFIFALRLLLILETGHVVQAERLGVAIAQVYASRLSLSARRSYCAPKLTEHAELLDCLGRILRKCDTRLWHNWCNPFDIESFIKLSHEELPDQIVGGQVVAAYDIPRFVRSHANNVLALAEVTDDLVRNDLLEHFVSIFEETHRRMKRDPWGWRIDIAERNEAVRPLIRLGQILQRIPERVASKLIARVEVADATALQLAELLAGLRDSRALADGLRPRVDVKAAAVLRKGGISLGEANHLGRALYHCGLVALAEQCASYALGLFSELQIVHNDQLRIAAIEILFASRVEQEKWQDVDELALSIVDPMAQLLIENWRALAALKRGQTDEALRRLGHILRQDPKDLMALVNTTAVHAARHDWSQCVAACVHAREMLGDATPAEVNSNRAQAHYQLREYRQAVEALDRLPPEKVRSPAMLVLRITLAITTAPVVSQLEDELRELEKTDPATADFLRARLAPLSHAAIGGAAFASGSLQREFVSLTLEERCAAVVGEDLAVYVLKVFSSAAQRMVEQSALALKLNEDQLTQILCLLLVPLQQLRIYAEVNAPGGWGPRRQGIADFELSEAPWREIGHRRRIVRGEAKEWKGPAWMRKGIKQIFATGNTGSEIFLLLVVYSKRTDFTNTVAKARKVLAEFGNDSANDFATLDAPECVSSNSGETQCIFRTTHGSPAHRDQTRILYTIVIDVRTERSRAVRHGTTRKPSRRTRSRSAGSQAK